MTAIRQAAKTAYENTKCLKAVERGFEYIEKISLL